MKPHIFGPEYGFATRAVHTGNDIDQDSGAIKRPITMANSYALPYDPTDMNWSSAGGNLYTRNGGTNQKYLQERLASLEGGEDCVVLASGVAALSGLFFALLNQGDLQRYLYCCLSAPERTAQQQVRRGNQYCGHLRPNQCGGSNPSQHEARSH